MEMLLFVAPVSTRYFYLADALLLRGWGDPPAFIITCSTRAGVVLYYGALFRGRGSLDYQ